MVYIMFTFLFIVTFITFMVLVLVAGMHPARSTMSRFELERRAGEGDAGAANTLRRELLLADVLSLLRIKVALLIVVMVLLCVVTFGWVIGVIVALFVALEYGAISRVSIIYKQSNKLYGLLEPRLLSLVEKLSGVFVFLRSTSRESNDPGRIDSRQELQHLIAESGAILSADERRLIMNGLSFQDQLVSSIMTPRTVIDTIKHGEFLGPLTLDELHKKGHSRLPVIKEDIDHVIGILHLQSLLALDIKRSVTAEKAMEQKVHYIRQDQTLQHALAAFLRTRHHMFIVVNEFRETVGLITLEDTMEALLGRRIIDEYDMHEDLRAVALRNPRDNNEPKKHEDV